MRTPSHPVVLPEQSDSDPAPRGPGASSQSRAGDSRVRLLVSACLLGEQVRYDGQHKYDPYLVDQRWLEVVEDPSFSSSVPRLLPVRFS